MFHYLIDELFSNNLQDAIEKLQHNPISNDWRGTNYQNFGLMADVTLPIYIVADREVQNERISEFLLGGGRNPDARKLGNFFHSFFEELNTKSRSFVFNCNNRRNIFGLQAHLDAIKDATIRSIMGDDYNSWHNARSDLEKLWYYESHQLLSRVYFYLSTYPNWQPKSIAEHVFCLRSEYQFDGSRLHISADSKIDILKRNGVNVVIEIKTGFPKDYHYLTVAGYALALESSPDGVNEIDIGCILYLDFVRRESIPRMKCKFYPLYNSYRQDFIEELKMKINWYSEHR